jgi:hypothetical protein
VRLIAGQLVEAQWVGPRGHLAAARLRCCRSPGLSRHGATARSRGAAYCLLRRAELVNEGDYVDTEVGGVKVVGLFSAANRV